MGCIIAYFVGFLIGYLTNRSELREIQNKAKKLEEFTKYMEEK